MRRRCIEQQTPPEMEPGDTVDHGEFFRNLKKEHVTKRYASDDDQEPTYGFKLHKSHWKYASHQGFGLSVNLRSCIHSEACSIALHPGGERYYHVALVDLHALNQCQFLTSPFVAQYRPIEESHNRCHFEIVPLDGTTLKWMELSELLDRPFPPAQKLPATAEDKDSAAREYRKYCSYFEIRRWIRKRDGSLA